MQGHRTGGKIEASDKRWPISNSKTNPVAGILKSSHHSLESLCKSSTHCCAVAGLVAHGWQNCKKPGNHQISTAVTYKVPLPPCSKPESRLPLNIPPPLVHEALYIWIDWCWGQHQQRCKPGYQTFYYLHHSQYTAAI